MVVADPDHKARLRSSAQAVAVDMESGALGAAAHAKGLPFVAVRAVSDTAAMAIPGSAKAAVDDQGRLQPARLLRALVARPAEIIDLWRLDRGFRAARRTLQDVVSTAGPRLALSE